MLEPGGETDLALESVRPHANRQLGVEYLQGDLAIVPEILSEVDPGHAALPQLPLDPVAIGEGRGETGSGVGHGHGGVGMSTGRSGRAFMRVLRDGGGYEEYVVARSTTPERCARRQWVRLARYTRRRGRGASSKKLSA